MRDFLIREVNEGEKMFSFRFCRDEIKRVFFFDRECRDRDEEILSHSLFCAVMEWMRLLHFSIKMELSNL